MTKNKGQKDKGNEGQSELQSRSAPSVPLSLYPFVPYSSLLRAGFSFTEILFAVIILGIGFIMVAAIFPVAIQQGKLTNEQTVAASVGRGALSLTGQLAGNTDSPMVSNSGSLTNSNVASFSSTYANTAGGPLLPATGTFMTVAGVTTAQPTGNVWSFRDLGVGTFQQLNGTATFSANNGVINSATYRVVDEMWSRVSQSLISPTDPRYAYVGMYRRDGDPRDHHTWSPFAQVWLIPVTTRSRTVYDTSSLPINNKDIGTVNAPMNLAARIVQVRIDKDPSANYVPQPTQGYMLYNYVAAGSPYTPSAVVTGAYVIIARDNIVSSTPPAAFVGNSGRMNGRIYHVGNRRPDLDDPAKTYQAFELSADGDFVPDAGVDGIFGTADDIYSIGNTTAPTVGAVLMTTAASAPADAYVVGTDIAANEAGTAQDISAYSTFIKVN